MLQISCLQGTYNLSPICILEKLVQLLQLVVKNLVDSILWLRVPIKFSHHYIIKSWLFDYVNPQEHSGSVQARSHRGFCKSWYPTETVCTCHVTAFYTIFMGGKVECYTMWGEHAKPQGYACPPSMYGQNLASQWTAFESDFHLQGTRYDWASL